LHQVDSPIRKRSRTVNTHSHHAQASTRYELRFQSLFNEGRGYAFPCDADGQVDLDTLSERLRNTYLFARTIVGRDLAAPAVRLSTLQ
jgi:hypothetical protein